MSDFGLLEQQGKGSATFYKPTTKLLIPTRTAVLGHSEGSNPSGLPLPEGLNLSGSALPEGLPVQEGSMTQNDDIVARLRDTTSGYTLRTVFDEAADEIERLRASQIGGEHQPIFTPISIHSSCLTFLAKSFLRF